MISDKTLNGLKLARLSGVKRGRKNEMHVFSKMACDKILNEFLADKTLSIEFLCEKFLISKPTFYKYCKINNINFREHLG